MNKFVAEPQNLIICPRRHKYCAEYDLKKDPCKQTCKAGSSSLGPLFNLENEEDFELGLQNLVVIPVAEFKRLNEGIHREEVIKPKHHKKIGKSAAKRCQELEKESYTNPLFTKKSRKGIAFRTMVQTEIEQLKCYEHMGL